MRGLQRTRDKSHSECFDLCLGPPRHNRGDGLPPAHACTGVDSGEWTSGKRISAHAAGRDSKGWHDLSMEGQIRTEVCARPETVAPN
jgi:hypothetical protein